MQQKNEKPGATKKKGERIAFEKAQAHGPSWPENHQSNQEQQESHTFFLQKGLTNQRK